MCLDARSYSLDAQSYSLDAQSYPFDACSRATSTCDFCARCSRSSQRRYLARGSLHCADALSEQSKSRKMLYFYDTCEAQTLLGALTQRCLYLTCHWSISS